MRRALASALLPLVVAGAALASSTTLEPPPARTPARTALAVPAASSWASTTGSDPAASWSTPLRRALETAGNELSTSGRVPELESLLRLCADAGAPERTIERWSEKWLRRAKRPQDWKRERVTSALQDALQELDRQLSASTAENELHVARLLLAVDDQHAEANRILGNTQHRDRWMTPEAEVAARGKERLEECARWARTLRFDVRRGPSTLVMAERLQLQGMRMVSARNVTLHSRLPDEQARRILTEALRAAALSYAATTGRRELPRLAHTVYVVLPADAYAASVDDALAASAIRADEADALRRLNSYSDGRGWYTSRWRSEAETQALLLYDLSRGWLGWSSAATLVAGHVNWVALRQLGSLLPHLVWQDRRFSVEERRQQTSGRNERRVHATSLMRTSSRSLYGTRRYLALLAERGEDPKWVRSMVDEVGKIQDENLLKTTLVCEYLMQTNEFADVLAATRGQKDQARAFEAALGRSLPDLELEWRDWLLDSGRGLLQRLRPRSATANEVARTLLDDLHDVRGKAFEKLARFGSRELWLDEELSDGGVRHAKYLLLHREQQSVWPAAHEEYSNLEGYSPSGAWAGAHSVIHIGTPEQAVDAWMATFYHRLPLLDPGLVGVGIGDARDVVVMDVLSLVTPSFDSQWVVWPPDKAEEVPLGFYPEIPLPVPGRATETLGYPITLQTFGNDPLLSGRSQLSFELRRDGPEGEAVPFHLSSPRDPLNPELVPVGAYCLIPDRHLAPNTSYYVTARSSGDLGKRLTWSFETGTQTYASARSR